MADGEQQVCWCCGLQKEEDIPSPPDGGALEAIGSDGAIVP